MDTTLRREQTALIPAEGRHWFWYHGRPFRVDSHRSEDKRGWSSTRTEWLIFRTCGRKQNFLKKFVADIVACHERSVALTSSLYIRDDDYWMRVEGYTPRSLDSVILKAGEKECLVQDIEKFKGAQERYRKLGVPYHRGYLFYGPPGSGKTSMVSALAGHFGMSIYAINLTDFNDKSLSKAINDVPTKSLILFEDIDCMKTGKARPDEEGAAREAPSGSTEAQDRLGVTLSGLLNVLDGFCAPENMLFVMTTNKMDMLDRALLRPGRIDYKLFFGDVLEEQKIELYRRFFPNTSESEARWFVESHESTETMAEFQGLLLDLGDLPPVSAESELQKFRHIITG
ncbi:MAG TPA: AAA family ATPase [Verrucomicrobiae bacterium]|nr:AAA family ATPase [Verrucomicrobiae bacterium]